MTRVSVPSSGDYQFLPRQACGIVRRWSVSVPSSGDYQFLRSLNAWILYHVEVSVPSSGDYQFLRPKNDRTKINTMFPSPHPGIINFFVTAPPPSCKEPRFRPLIRGLSISSTERFSPTSTLTSFRPLIRGLSISS